MYYHNSPTVRNIKLIKESRAQDMACAVNGMKQVSADYAVILKELDTLRSKELQADSIIAAYPEQAGAVSKKMKHKYTIMKNKIERFLTE